jgi:hypothetical protein
MRNGKSVSLVSHKKGNGSHPFPFTLIAEPFAGHVLMIRAQRKIFHFSFQIFHLSLSEDTALLRVEMAPESWMVTRLEAGQTTLPNTGAEEDFPFLISKNFFIWHCRKTPLSSWQP